MQIFSLAEVPSIGTICFIKAFLDAGMLYKKWCCTGIGPFLEVAFFHKRTRTLLTTDSVIFVPQTAPEVMPSSALNPAVCLQFAS